MTVKVSPKYQVVIPEEVRTALGIQVGSRIDVIAKGKVAYLVPVQSMKDLQKNFASVKIDSAIREKKDRKL